MRTTFITGLILLLPFLGFSQGEWNNWYFGWHAGMTFNSGSPVALPTSAFTQSAGCTSTSVSDSAGNFLFYTDGYRVYNKNQIMMPNGYLGIWNALQGSFAVPKIGDRNVYYLFTVGHFDGSSLQGGLQYSVIDMSLQSGLGDVVSGSKNIPLPFGDSAIEQLYPIRHTNNRDVWVVALRHGIQNQYLAYLIDEGGISLSPVVSNSLLKTVAGPGSFKPFGDLRISPDGTRLICSDSLAELCDFNPTTGVVTPRFLFRPNYLVEDYFAWRAEFSVDSRFLYLAVHTQSPVFCPGWQFDTDQPDSASFVQSQTIIGIGPSGQLQMAPDGKIYIDNQPFSDSLHVINYPSLPGLACGFQKNAFCLQGNYCNGSLPQFLQKYKAYIHHAGHCLSDTTQFSGDIWPPPDSIHWDFGDPASGSFNFSNTVSPKHRFTAVGQYTVKLFVRHNDDRCDSTLAVVNIYPKPIPVITGYPNAIVGSVYTYSTAPGMSNYQWTYSPGGARMTGGGPGDATIGIRWDSPGPQWVRVNYTDANGCEAIIPSQKDVMVFLSFIIDFVAPDTVCVGGPVVISNLSQGGSTWDWSFCSGGAGEMPTAVNIGNPVGMIHQPTCITLVREGDTCYSVIGNSVNMFGSMIKYSHGNSFMNDPVGWIPPFGYSILPSTHNDGIQVKFDTLAGEWYGFVTNDSIIWRYNIGPSLGAVWISAQSVGPNPMLKKAHGIQIVKEGNTWIALVVCRQSNNLVRLNFGISLSNLNPTFTDLGNVAGFNGPTAMQLMKENGNWYALISAGNNSLARVSFGSSLLNTPTGINLGNPGGFNNEQGLTITNDCGEANGNFTNMIINGEVGKLSFPGGLAGPVTGQSLGNIGALNQPYAISEIVREDDTLVAYVLNYGSNSMTRLVWTPCSNASISSSTQFTPPPFTYNQPGTYRINLLVDRGMPTHANLCKEIVVRPGITVNLGNDHTVCEGTVVTLDAGPGYSGFLWSTGATTQSIQATTAGSYWVKVTQNGCEATDSVMVNWIPAVPVSINISSSENPVCTGTPVTFTATITNGGTNPVYQWKVNGINAGTGNPVFTYVPANNDQVTCSLLSNVQCSLANPVISNTITMMVNPPQQVSIVIVASPNPFCQGEPVTFTAVATNGGPTPFYQWLVNGANQFTGSPVFTYTPNDGDVVVCILTSSDACVTGNPATSNPITMVVNTSLPAGVNIAASDNPFCPGEPVTFTGAAMHGGSTPLWQWLVNGSIVFTGSPVYTFTPQSGDSIRCIMTSNLACVTGNPASSNKIIMTEKISPNVTFIPCFDTITTTNAKPFRLKGGLPLGGTYSGPGVNSTTGTFTPSLAGPGNHQISYTYTNAHGCQSISHSIIQSFNQPAIPCGNPFTDPRDGKVYATVQIGSQCWMQKNLEFGMTIDELIPQTDNCIAERYNRQASIVQSYMYQWDELMTYQTAEGSQGLCPPGWHVPSESDWTVLFSLYQGASRAGRPLQDTVINGFKALMSGVLFSQTFLNYEDFATILWSSTLSGSHHPDGVPPPRRGPTTLTGSDRAMAHGMNNWNFSVSLYPALRSNGFGVRCLRDQ